MRCQKHDPVTFLVVVTLHNMGPVLYRNAAGMLVPAHLLFQDLLLLHQSLQAELTVRQVAAGISAGSHMRCMHGRLGCHEVALLVDGLRPHTCDLAVALK